MSHGQAARCVQSEGVLVEDADVHLYVATGKTVLL